VLGLVVDVAAGLTVAAAAMLAAGAAVVVVEAGVAVEVAGATAAPVSPAPVITGADGTAAPGTREKLNCAMLPVVFDPAPERVIVPPGATGDGAAVNTAVGAC
jgi:hypothetical protein